MNNLSSHIHPAVVEGPGPLEAQINTWMGGAPLSTTGLLNITNLQVNGDDTNVMPSLMVVVRF